MPLLVLSCLLYCTVWSLMYALEEEYLCLREIFINVNMLAMLLLPVYLFIGFLIMRFVAVYLYNFLLVLLLLNYFFISFFYIDVCCRILSFMRWHWKHANYFCCVTNEIWKYRLYLITPHYNPPVMLKFRPGFETLKLNCYLIALRQRCNQHVRNIRTCIHNWSAQSFNQDYNIASHTTYICCVY